MSPVYPVPAFNQTAPPAYPTVPQTYNATQPAPATEAAPVPTAAVTSPPEPVANATVAPVVPPTSYGEYCFLFLFAPFSLSFFLSFFLSHFLRGRAQIPVGDIESVCMRCGMFIPKRNCHNDHSFFLHEKPTVPVSLQGGQIHSHRFSSCRKSNRTEKCFQTGLM